MTLIKINEYITSNYICLNLKQNTTTMTSVKDNNIILGEITYEYLYINPIISLVILIHLLFFCVVITIIYKKKIKKNNNNDNV